MIVDIHLTVNICIERPFPDLSMIIESLQRHRSIVRFINIICVRSPATILGEAFTQVSEAMLKCT